MTRRAGGQQQIPRPELWREGAPPPWPVPSPALRTHDIVTRLGSTFDPQPEPDPDGPRPSSAVLLVLADGPHGAELLLTRRPWHIRTHKGEVSFPGGRLEPGETFEQAALREAYEEVGLPSADVQVVGRLHPIRLAVSATWVVPVVGRVAQPMHLLGHDAEVDRVFWVPLHDFTMPGTYREEYWDIGFGEHPISFYDLDDETVWGLTGRILTWLLEVVYDVQGRTPPTAIEPMP